MDEVCPSPDWHEIIAQLRLEAGCIMEDTSSELALVLPKSHVALNARLREASEAGDDIQILLAAAQVLNRRCLSADRN